MAAQAYETRNAELGTRGIIVVVLDAKFSLMHYANMKITDSYNARIDIWAREGKVVRIPRIANLPAFGHRRFSSYEELRQWKQSLLGELAKLGGAKWTK